MRPFFKKLLRKTFIVLYTNKNRVINLFTILFLSNFILGFIVEKKPPLEIAVAVIIINSVIFTSLSYAIDRIYKKWTPNVIQNHPKP